jgi:hypothetical protein
MTVGVFSYPGSTVENFGYKLTGTSPVVIAGNATAAMQVPWFACTEITGGTPNLTIELYDGTTSFYLRNAKAMTAKETVLIDYGLWLNPGTFLRITASVANQIDVVGLRSLPNAQSGP